MKMNSQFFIEKLNSSEEFKKFKKENPNAYLCSGFFVIDIESKDSDNKYHFDFYIPSSKKTFSFELENGIRLIPLERNGEQVLEKISMKNHFDFDEIKEMIMKEMEYNKINNKIQKMLFSLQNVKGKELLIGTIFISGLGILKANINLSENKITEFEKKSFFDMMKIIRK